MSQQGAIVPTVGDKLGLVHRNHDSKVNALNYGGGNENPIQSDEDPETMVGRYDTVEAQADGESDDSIERVDGAVKDLCMERGVEFDDSLKVGNIEPQYQRYRWDLFKCTRDRDQWTV
jgi:hypothetical protein